MSALAESARRVASARRMVRTAVGEAGMRASAAFMPRRRATCPLCRTDGALLIEVGTLRPTHPGPFHVDRFTMEHCRECQCMFLTPAPNGDDLRTLYLDSEQFESHEYSEARAGAILDYLTTAIHGRRLLPPGRARCLEVGAGRAWMSRACKAQRGTVVTVAQDVSPEAARSCPWVDRYYVGELAALMDEAPFDLISLTHVIEHLIDPLATLVQLAARLAPGGKLFVTAPFRPEGWPVRGYDLDVWRRYSYLHVPAHISYLSRRWFEKAQSRAGLRLEFWDQTADRCQAFEAVLAKVTVAER